MLAPLFSFGAFAAVMALFAIFKRPVWGIIPALLAGGGVFLYFTMKVGKALQTTMDQVQRLLTPSSPMSQKKPPIGEAIRILEGARKYQKWVFWVDAQIVGQIGMLYYMQKQWDDARPYLEKSTARNWMAKAMLAATHYKRKEYDAMKSTFEVALKHSAKESLLWNMYAWCLWKIGEKDEAIAVLNRALAKVGEEERTQKNLKALQNNKKMKMQGWQQMWWQFFLEPIPKQQLQAMQLGRQRMSKRDFRGR